MNLREMLTEAIMDNKLSLIEARDIIRKYSIIQAERVIYEILNNNCVNSNCDKHV